MTAKQNKQRIRSEALNKIIRIYSTTPEIDFVDAEGRDDMVRHIITKLHMELDIITKKK
jgi:hypothetical protein